MASRASSSSALLLLLVAVQGGCSSTSPTPAGAGADGGSTSSGGAATGPACTAGTSCQIGDGTPASIAISEIYAATASAELIDLAFNAADPTELWVLGYGNDSVYLGSGVGETNGTWKRLHDPAASHFMHNPPAIAWGAAGLWATCSDSAGDPKDFTGPALFSSDLSVFTTQNATTKLGSHLDMLHNTSFCRGVAHVEANWFWTFNGQLGSLEKYNFAEPHEPGGDDHKDGEIYRYAQGQVKGVEGVPSHLAYDATDKFLYVADTGNKRIVRLDTTRGTLTTSLPRRNEPLAANGVMVGADVEEVVPPGVLEQPSGLELHGGHIYVTDAATGRFHVFDKTGKELRKLETGLPARALAGFTFGPDGKIWFVDRVGSRVLRIDPVK
jgi:hypothetical protein